MANLGYITLEKNDEYVNLEQAFGFNFVEGETYHIQIQGAGMFFEGIEKPEIGGTYWNILKPFDYIKGTDTLWVQVQSNVMNINVWDDSASEPPAVWFDFNSEGFTSVFDAEAKTNTFTKDIDGYDVELVWSYDDEATGFTATVTKDGESAGTASVWFVSENGDIKLNVSDLTLEATSENSFDYMSGESWGDGYYGSFSNEVDAEFGTSIWLSGETYYEEEASEPLYLKIKLEA